MNQERYPWWMRIKVRVLVFGIAMSILPLLFLGLASFNAARLYLQGSIQEQNYTRAVELAGEIQGFMGNMADSLTHVTSTNALNLVGYDPMAREIILGTMLREMSDLEGLEVSDAQFRVLGRVSRREVILPLIPGQKLENLEFAGERPFFISGVSFSEDGRPQVYLTVGIQNPNTRQTIGYLQAKGDLKGLVTKFIDQKIGQAGYVYLTDEKGKLVGHTDFSRVLGQKSVQQNPTVQSFLAGKNSSHRGEEYDNAEGIRVMGMFAQVGTPNWGVFIEQPVREAYEPISQFALKVLGMVLVGIAGVTLLSVVFGLKLTRPIEHLEEGVRQIISTGDLQTKIPKESDDEIGHLVESFNNMLSQLEEKNERLKIEKELLKTVVNGIGAGMVLIDENKQILWWNSIFADWFGTEDLFNRSCATVVQGEGMKCLFNENGRVFPLDVNGDRRYIRQMYYGLTPGNLERADYLLLLEDVTQQVEMEARVIETEKMASVGLLASGLAHEINNPLAIISAHSEDFLDRLNEGLIQPDNQELRTVLKLVSEQVERCKQITYRLLNFARRGNHGQDLVDISRSAEQALAMLAHRAKQNKLVFLNLMEPGLLVMGNENEWQQVMFNILSNAIDASKDGGTIEVRAHRDGKIMIEVQDQGQGISTQHLRKVFDPFFTTKPPGQGTGLGMFISYGIIQKMRGYLTIESVEGEGTTVRIEFPSIKVEDKG